MSIIVEGLIFWNGAGVFWVTCKNRVDQNDMKWVRDMCLMSTVGGIWRF